MIDLKLVGASTDLEHLVFSTKKGGRRGSHVAAIDDKLFRVLEDVVRKRRAREKGAQAVKAPPAEPKLAPREVQRMLRAGRDVAAVARSAGMDVAWVERFLGPVLDERAIAIQDSQRARLEKQRLGISGASLGDSVARNLRARHVKITDDELASAWNASRTDAQPWVISLSFPYRGREQRAVWRYDPHAREVTAVNRLGSDLGWVADARRPAPRPAARSAARTKPAPKKAARKKAAPRPARKAVKRKAATKKTAGRKSTAKKTTKRKTVARKPARRPAAAKRRSRR